MEASATAVSTRSVQKRRSMVDLILGRGLMSAWKIPPPIVYIPLRARDETLGILMLDTLLSQQEILGEQIPLCRRSRPVKHGDKNARLFAASRTLDYRWLTGLYICAIQTAFKENSTRRATHATFRDDPWTSTIQGFHEPTAIRGRQL